MNECRSIAEAMLAESHESLHRLGLIDWLQENGRGAEAGALARWSDIADVGRKKYLENHTKRSTILFKRAPAIVLLGLACHVASWPGALTATRRRRVAQAFAAGPKGDVAFKRWIAAKKNRTTRSRYLRIRNVAIVNGSGTLGSDLYYSIGDAAAGHGMDSSLTGASLAVWYPDGHDELTEEAVDRGVSDWFDGWVWLCGEAAKEMKPRKKRS